MEGPLVPPDGRTPSALPRPSGAEVAQAPHLPAAQVRGQAWPRSSHLSISLLRPGRFNLLWGGRGCIQRHLCRRGPWELILESLKPPDAVHT